MRKQQARGSSGDRSNLYSQDKCTNWAYYDPFWLEVESVPKSLKSEVVYILNNGEAVKIFSIPVRRGFLRPFEAQDVVSFIERVPEEFLIGLEGIYLLGGTQKQKKAAFGSLFCYGFYWSQKIFLHSFPENCLILKYENKRPKPSRIEEYRRAGAKLKEVKGGLEIEFDPGSLKQFFLREVLMHEIGYHVDRFRVDRNIKSSERFADWFAMEYGYKLRRPETD